MTSLIRRAWRSAGDRGASAVEYGLMVTAVAALIVLVVFGFGSMVQNTFGKTTDCIQQLGHNTPAYPNCPTRTTP